jgi:hypothetical protein
MALIMLILAGCSGASSPFKGRWVAAPSFQEADHSFCRARLSVKKGDNAYYSYFLLSLVNKGDEALYIDWNASRYLFNGKPQGGLVFEGIDPEAVKNNAVPVEAIAPGETFKRPLMPMRLIAWTPIRDKSTTSRSITPGMLPAGDNGIRLSLRQAGNRIRLPLSVSIALEKHP